MALRGVAGEQARGVEARAVAAPTGGISKLAGAVSGAIGAGIQATEAFGRIGLQNALEPEIAQTTSKLQRLDEEVSRAKNLSSQAKALQAAKEQGKLGVAEFQSRYNEIVSRYTPYFLNSGTASNVAQNAIGARPGLQSMIGAIQASSRVAAADEKRLKKKYEDLAKQSGIVSMADANSDESRRKLDEWNALQGEIKAKKQRAELGEIARDDMKRDLYENAPKYQAFHYSDARIKVREALQISPTDGQFIEEMNFGTLTQGERQAKLGAIGALKQQHLAEIRSFYNKNGVTGIEETKANMQGVSDFYDQMESLIDGSMTTKIVSAMKKIKEDQAFLRIMDAAEDKDKGMLEMIAAGLSHKMKPVPSRMLISKMIRHGKLTVEEQQRVTEAAKATSRELSPQNLYSVNLDQQTREQMFNITMNSKDPVVRKNFVEYMSQRQDLGNTMTNFQKQTVVQIARDYRSDLSRDLKDSIDSTILPFIKMDIDNNGNVSFQAIEQGPDQDKHIMVKESLNGSGVTEHIMALGNMMGTNEYKKISELTGIPLTFNGIPVEEQAAQRVDVGVEEDLPSDTGINPHIAPTVISSGPTRGERIDEQVAKRQEEDLAIASAEERNRRAEVEQINREEQFEAAGDQSVVRAREIKRQEQLEMERSRERGEQILDEGVELRRLEEIKQDEADVKKILEDAAKTDNPNVFIQTELTKKINMMHKIEQKKARAREILDIERSIRFLEND